ncbi:MAG: protein-L-isoaspartate(D-aspartate) O-methyltransferase [Planctomycetes bacterium]|nr:protein-L-isoaspartate(D-aspartate) O-methyltransferase [Planctomycetota bacterium]MCB9917001.1 protein-L-isoaspartate(D-aspartate) O-methyltransferase [Planctomycetota bacterium]
MNKNDHKLAEQRTRMVDEQLVPRGIRDRRVLSAMSRVPRESFVPAHMVAHAFDDRALPIGEEQTISQPFIVAMMAQSAELRADDRVLEIGTGSGYGAAVLAELARDVYSIERNPVLARKSRERLQRLGYDRIHLRCGDGTKGWPEAAPFDAIIVTAGGPEVPESLREQLAVGGRLLIPVGKTPRHQSLRRVRRVSMNDYRNEALGNVVFVPLIGEQGWHDDA